VTCILKVPKFHMALHASHGDLNFPSPCSAPNYIKISSKCSRPDITHIIQPSAKLFSAAYSMYFTIPQLTFFTFQRPTLPPTYLYQKNAGALHGVLQSRYIFPFLFNKFNFTRYISPIFLYFFSSSVCKGLIKPNDNFSWCLPFQYC
jgi:hypothetical protein